MPHSIHSPPVEEEQTSPSPLPYWLVNVAKDQWPSSCPDFLLNIKPKSQRILATPDDQYHRQTWPEVKEIIRTNRIDFFQRVPSDLRKYLEYTAKIKRDYGSVLAFVVKERLGWGEDLRPKGTASFEDESDIKILYNDWPYGIDPKIVHLVVWTKFDLEDDPATDDLTPKAREEIGDFVRKTFWGSVPAEDVIWFKNWSSLKSVHAVEHFHVMLYEPDMEFVKEVTGGDVPLVEKLKGKSIE